ncbi:hypothetical protein D3C76_903320 [compost metagenome]
MIFQRLARSCLVVDDGHVIGLDEVLHQEFPVAFDFAQVDFSNGLECRHIEQLDSLGKAGAVFGEIHCIAGQVDENPVIPDRMTNRNQAVVFSRKAWNLLHPIAAEMGRRFQLAVQPIGPGVIGATD